MTFRTQIIVIVFLSIGITSCNRIKNKSEQITNNVKEKTKTELKRQSKKLIDKVFPPFDYNQPDTDNNKSRFRDFIQIELSEDIKNIYCFDDTIGIDSDYMFAFHCNTSSSKKIIETHNLTLDTLNLDNGFALQHDFIWWPKERIQKLQKYSWEGEHQNFKYFWYDPKDKKAYFFSFNL